MKRADYRQRMHDIEKRPKFYGVDGSWGQYVAYLEGLDAGSDQEALAGFREWLVERLGKGDNLAWPGLVYNLAFTKYPTLPETTMNGPKDPAFHEQLIKTLFNLLDEFFAGQPAG